MIVLEQLSRIFKVGDEQVHGLRQVDLTIGKGEYVAIMGPSGSGKSTLLNMIGSWTGRTAAPIFSKMRI